MIRSGVLSCCFSASSIRQGLQAQASVRVGKGLVLGSGARLARGYAHHKNTTETRRRDMAMPAAEGRNAEKMDAGIGSGRRYMDIGINLTDPVYEGVYHGSQRHAADRSAVVARAARVGCKTLIVTGSDLAESKRAVELAKEYAGSVFATVGVHPCSTLQFLDPDERAKARADAESDVDAETDQTPSPYSAAQISQIAVLATSATASGHAVAFGEIGLDYDRLTLSPRATQLRFFALQLDVAASLATPLPLFLHSRAAHADFVRLLSTHAAGLLKSPSGVVHSFTGTRAEMEELLALGLDIGINGCSMKTAANIAVVRALPLTRLHLETDGPWCEMRPSHASAAYLQGDPDELTWTSVKKERWIPDALVKGRNEPCLIPRVARAVAAIKGVSVDEVVQAAWANGVRMFGVGGVV